MRTFLTNRLKKENLHVSLLYVAVLFLLFFYSPSQPPETTPGFTTLPPIKAAEKILTKEIKVAKVVVLDKEAVARKIALPAEVLNPPQIEVTATGKVPPAPHGAEVIAVLDTDTGRTTLHASPVPAPFLALKNDKRIGVGYGIGEYGTPTTKIYGEWTVLRVDKVYLGVQGVLQHNTVQGPSAAAFVLIDYRF